jgi:DNA polymerase-4
LPVDFDEYRKYSRAFKAAVRAIAPIVEDRGIDEIYIDLSAARRRARGPRRARRPRLEGCGARGDRPHVLDRHHAEQAAVRRSPRSSTSPTASPCSDHADIPARIWPLAARKVNGIGPKAAAKLAALGIETIGDVAAAEPAFLGRALRQELRRLDARRGARPRRAAGRSTESEPESISRETTFDRDLHAVRDRGELGAIFTDLCMKLAGRPVAARAYGRPRRSASSCASTTSG